MDNAEVLRIRNDFPVLDQLVNGRPLIYLDSGATSQNPLSVIEAEQEFYEQRNAAVHRGAHHLAVEATEVFEDARQTVADFIGRGLRGNRLDLQRHGGPEPHQLCAVQRRAVGCPGARRLPAAGTRPSARGTKSWSPKWNITQT